MGMQDATLACHPSLSPSQIADLRLAASQMSGPTRRAFEAEMAVKYCGGTPLLAETLFGWGRQTVALGLAERRTGLMCLGAQSAFSGRKRWEDRHQQAAAALRQRLCRKFCLGGREGVIAPVGGGMTRPGSKTVRPSFPSSTTSCLFLTDNSVTYKGL